MRIAGKKIQELKKKELVRIVELLLEKNPANITYLEHHFRGTKPDREASLSLIEKEMADHQGSYAEAYDPYRRFKETSPDEEDILVLSLEAAEYFFEEIDLYAGDPPDSLLSYAEEIFSDACQLAAKLERCDCMRKLREMLPDLFDEDVAERFHDAFSHFPLNFCDDEDY